MERSNNIDALFKNYFQNFYGPAGEIIQKYFRQLQEKAKDQNIHMHLYSGLEAGYLDKDFLSRSYKLLNSAESAVKGNTLYEKRVERVRMSLDYTNLLMDIEYIIKLGKLIPTNLDLKLQVLNRFKEQVEQFGVQNMGEDVGIDWFLTYCEEKYQKYSIEALLELAPSVMKIINYLLKKVDEMKDSKNNFKLLDMAPSALKLGLNPRSLMQWLQDNNIVTYNENNIWERKLNEKELNKWKHLKFPKPDLKAVKMIASKYLEKNGN